MAIYFVVQKDTVASKAWTDWPVNMNMNIIIIHFLFFIIHKLFFF